MAVVGTLTGEHDNRNGVHVGGHQPDTAGCTRTRGRQAHTRSTRGLQPSAAWTAPCSCRISMWRMGASIKTFVDFQHHAAGVPKMASTPSCCRASRRRSRTAFLHRRLPPQTLHHRQSMPICSAHQQVLRALAAPPDQIGFGEKRHNGSWAHCTR
jgi:hypothetical protein